MDRLVYVIESSAGYLCDIEQYTKDIAKAITFVEYDTAVKKLAAIRNKLITECRVNMHCIPFPHPIGYASLLPEA
jgi:hypothetical protein